MAKDGMRMRHRNTGQPLLCRGFSQRDHYPGVHCLELLQDPGAPGVYLFDFGLTVEAARHEVEKTGLIFLKACRLQDGLSKEPAAFTGQGNSSHDFDPVRRGSDKDRLCVLNALRLHLHLV